MNFFAKKVILPLLKLVEDNQEYLCESDNLPQLAKLLFIVNKLWNAGSLSFGIYDNDSDSNYIKNDLSKIKYKSKRNEDLIYAAWNIHIINDTKLINYESFIDLIINGCSYSEYDIRYNTINKTFDDWVFLLTHPNFKYHTYFPNRKSVANYLLCLDNNGFFYNNNSGMICKTAGDIEIDIDLFSNWENSKFCDNINKIVIDIVKYDVSKIAINTEYKYLKQKPHAQLYRIDDDKKILYESCFVYYPINNKSIITKLNEYTHPSYIKASYDIYYDIVTQENNYSSYIIENIGDKNITMCEFAISFIKFWKEYINLLDEKNF